MSRLIPRAIGAALLASCMVAAAADGPGFDAARTEPVDFATWKPFDPQRVATPVDATLTPLPADPVTATETEPNDTSATANVIPLVGGAGRISGFAVVNTDADWYAITAPAGSRLYAATQTQASASANGDSTLDVFASDGTTILETDLDDGSLASTSSVIAGTNLPTAGTYYLRVRANGTSQLRPYDLYVQVRSGSPTAEIEPNNSGTPQLLGAARWISGTVDSTTDNDTYSFDAAAGDTVWIATDGDPTRDTTDANLRIGLGVFNSNFLVVNDAGTATPDGESFFMTVRTAGTYTVYVDAPAVPIGDYHLSISVFPAPTRLGTCTTYSSAAGGPINDLAATTFPITVPDNVRIEDVDVSVDLTHASPPDLDITLQSPQGVELPLMTDIGNAAQPAINVTFDDEAAIPAGPFTVLNGMPLRPEVGGRLEQLDGTLSNGPWTLVIRDDLATNAGTLNGWSLRICEKPPAPVVCPAGTALATAYTSDFETDEGGFTHSGTVDEWQRGLPSFAPITTCAGGTNCWKTDLDNTYDPSSIQDLSSPPIDLTGFVAPIEARWSHRYSMESATFDHYRVTAASTAASTSVVLFDWTGATMNQTIGNPGVAVQFSAGWSPNAVNISALAGAADAQLTFHVDTDSSVNLTGVAVDDVSVVGCRAINADLGVTITDGATTANAGDTVTYTVVTSSPAEATGPVSATTSTSVDPQLQSCAWSCTGSGGTTCGAPSGTGNVADTGTLPASSQLTYVIACVLPGGATGTLTSSASVVIGGGSDPQAANNTAADTDTIVPAADLVFGNGFE